MKYVRAFSTALALAGSMALPGKAAAVEVITPFRQLGWVSSMKALCLDPGCLTVAFTLDLTGLGPTDNTGDAVPAGLGSSGGYVNWLVLGDAGVNFTGASINSGGTWFSIPILSTLLNFSLPPYPVDPIVVVATFSSSAYAKTFGYGGNAFLNPNGSDVTGACNAGTCVYKGGDFNGSATATPEPVTMSLLATGLVGLMLVARRKRRRAV